jgi:hypothetical protein
MNYQNYEQYSFDDDILLLENPTSPRTNIITAKNYAKNVLGKLSLMRDNTDLCDFRIDINNKKFLCHKFFLIATSDYFKAMFNGLN